MSSDTLTIRNPFDGRIVTEKPLRSLDDVLRRADTAQQRSLEWRQNPISRRIQRVKQGLDYFRDNREQVAHDITLEMGKPIGQSEGEIDFGIERAEHLCAMAEDALRPVVPDSTADFEGRIENNPKGVIYIISPWNYPIFTAINGVVPALLAGNGVLLKHSSVPRTGEHFERAFGEPLYDVSAMDFDTSAGLIQEGDINHVVFTGSVRGGRQVQKNVNARMYSNVRNPFLQTTLELGSNDASYIAPDADLERAVDMIVNIGRLHNTGQSCCAVKRLYVHESVYDEVVGRAEEHLGAHISGDPFNPDTTLGPLYGGREAVASLREMVKDAVAKGAHYVAGKPVPSVAFLRPALLPGADHSMHVMNEETFGPVLPIMSVSSDEEAMRLVEDTPYGLTASIFTTDRERAERFIGGVRKGTVYVDRCNFVDARLAWTAAGLSGNYSASLSPLGFSAFVEPKSVNIDPGVLE